MNSPKIIITGAAGLVGQNLILLLQEMGYHHIVALDKHSENLQILQQLNPHITCVEADLAITGEWQHLFKEQDILIQLHAQITSKNSEDFTRNNLTATKHVLAAAKRHNVPFIVHSSSSVVNSKAEDDYVVTKTAQEQLVIESGIDYCVLRPTLMFGWFDRKHLGWLSRLMQKSPIFPIPGQGRYTRQPLYARDFCQLIIAALQKQPKGAIFDIVGKEDIDYIDIIRTIKKVKGLKTIIIKIPYGVFYSMLKCAALIMAKPPFTAAQLQALTVGDYFQGIDTEKTLNVTLTPLSHAFEETFTHEKFSKIILQR